MNELTPKYAKRDRIRHYKGGAYTVLENKARIEATEEHAYVYQADVDGSIWVRPAHEIEDNNWFTIITREEEYCKCRSCGRLNVLKAHVDPKDEFSDLCFNCTPD